MPMERAEKHVYRLTKLYEKHEKLYISFIQALLENLYKLSKKHEKLYRLTTKKLNDVELDREELSTKVDEPNQTIEVLRFENNFLTKKTKKLEAELFQVRAQLERTSSAKLDEMLNLQKSASDRDRKSVV